jgi:peptide/nickel transport system substrate-binding protein
MENKFGLKDMLLVALLLGVLLMIGLAMKQFDRQWDEMKETRRMAADQTRELIAIRSLLEQGGVSIGGGGERRATTRDIDVSTLDPNDPFYGVKRATTQPGFARGDWLSECFPVKVPKLTPLLSSDLYASIVQARVLETLAYRNPETLEFVPLLAKSWEVKDNTAAWEAAVKAAKAKGAKDEDVAKDNSIPAAIEIKFVLRDDVEFSDGVPFTADDVVFTFDWVMNPKVDAPRERTGYTQCRAVRKTGPHEVVFEWREPFFEAFANSADLSVMPKHLYEKYTPQQFNETVGLLMGTGPYRLESPTEWRPGKPIVLLRNERYWGERPTFDRLPYLEVEEEAPAMTMFLNGEYDVFAANPDQYKQMKDDPKVKERTNFFRYYNMIGGYTYIAWNQKRAGQGTLFADKRVRQALTMLINRQGIIDNIYQGFGRVATGPFGYGSKQNDPSVQAWPYDPVKGKALLKEAGFEDRNKDGVIEGPDGKPFSFRLIYPNKSPITDKLALYLKDNLARAGVNLEPDPTEWSIMIKKIDSRDFDAMTLGWSGSVENDIFQMFDSSQIEGGGDNYMSYSNAELDRAMHDARTSVDEAKRIPLWQKCHRILHEDQPYTFLMNRESLVFIDKRIRNVSRSKVSLNYVERFPMPVPWYVPRGEQKHR